MKIIGFVTVLSLVACSGRRDPPLAASPRQSAEALVEPPEVEPVDVVECPPTPVERDGGALRRRPRTQPARPVATCVPRTEEFDLGPNKSAKLTICEPVDGGATDASGE